MFGMVHVQPEALDVGSKCLARARKLLHFALQGSVKCQKSPYKDLRFYRHTLGTPAPSVCLPGVEQYNVAPDIKH